VSPEQLWHWEHSYLRVLHPNASDAEIARKVDQFQRDALQRIEDRAAVVTVRVAVDAMTEDMAKLTIGDLSWVMARPDAKRVADMLTGTAKRGTSGWTTVDVQQR
jgi:hypothetical protein